MPAVAIEPVEREPEPRFRVRIVVRGSRARGGAPRAERALRAGATWQSLRGESRSARGDLRRSRARGGRREPSGAPGGCYLAVVTGESRSARATYRTAESDSDEGRGSRRCARARGGGPPAIRFTRALPTTTPSAPGRAEGSLLGRGNAEAGHDGNGGMPRACAPEGRPSSGGSSVRAPVTPGDGDGVDEALGVGQNPPRPLGGRWWGGDQADQMQVVGVQVGENLGHFLVGNIDDEHCRRSRAAAASAARAGRPWA